MITLDNEQLLEAVADYLHKKGVDVGIGIDDITFYIALDETVTAVVTVQPGNVH